jgi:amino acid transporter
MNRLQIPILPSIVNAAVLISIFSTTNSFVFAASRSLFGLAQRGQAPKVLARTNKRGVPWVAVSLTLVVGCLAYLSVSQGSIKVLNWWINLVTAAQLVSWTCIAMWVARPITWGCWLTHSTYLRFRKGIFAQGLANGTFLPVKGWLQPYSGWVLVVCSPIVLFFSGYYVFLPGAFTAPDFIFAYGSVFIFFAILLLSKTYQFVVKKQKQIWHAPREIDFVTDLDKFEALTVAAEYKRATKSKGPAKKVEDFFF